MKLDTCIQVENTEEVTNVLIHDLYSKVLPSIFKTDAAQQGSYKLCVCVCVHPCVHACVHACVCAYVCACMPACVCVCVCV